ncbi:ABC transporter permease [Gorillibacterium timonense]|uniref:ABC transporter permease n=1 Tax=Gorillibacterium timonense TaxID=1689269 RepID=UPI00071D7774|nr:ABC-2 family transporter protein [Gorillibacterium timonense]
MNLLRLYVMLIRASIRSRMQYKFNFWLSSLLATLVNVSEFLMVAVVLAKFGGIQGWSLYEVGYLYSVISLSRVVYRSLASDVHNLDRYLVSGDLDQLLIRPLPLLLALMSQNFRIMLGEALQGGGILLYCLYKLIGSGQMDWIAVPLTLWIVLTGAMILFSIGLATSTIGFWITKVDVLQTLTEDASRSAAQYPLTLYPKWLRSLFFTVIPVAFANYVPALYVLRHQYGLWVLFATTAVAVFCLTAALGFWRVGMSRYQSTGS